MIRKSTTKNAPIHNTAKRAMAKKTGKLKKKSKKAVWKPPSEALLTGAKPAAEEVYKADPRPENFCFPATSAHMPSEYVGYKFAARLNEFQVDNISPLHKRFGEKLDGSGNRFSFIGYSRTKPFSIKAFPRDKGSGVSRNLREVGWIPAAVQHVSNGKNHHMNIYIDPVTLEKYKVMKAAWAVEWHFDVDGMQEPVRALLRDWQIDPVTQRTGSMRFLGTSTTHPTHIHLPIEFEGGDDGNASKKGAMMLTPQTNVQGIFDPSLAARLGTGSAPFEISAEVHDREPHHTLRVGDIALPPWISVPKGLKWNKHVLMTFTKDGG